MLSFLLSMYLAMAIIYAKDSGINSLDSMYMNTPKGNILCHTLNYLMQALNACKKTVC